MIINHLTIILISSFSAFLLTFLLSPFFIQFLIKNKFAKNLRDTDSTWRIATIFNKLHKEKKWTPTMWWILIWWVVLIIILFSRLLSYFWYIDSSLLDRWEIYLPLFTLIFMWFLGAIDDYLNIIQSKHKWLHHNPKLFFILLFALIWGLWFYFKLWYTSIYIPFLWDLNIWILYIPFFIFLVTWTANAVNITDWLDWLATWLLISAFFAFWILAYFKWLYNLSIFCAIIVWTLAAFLWNNIPPAKFYMWDTWSLALWATLWVIWMMIDKVFVLPIIWWIFLFEIISVIIQLTSKKLRNWKKIFKIAPFHHHLEAIWWTESQIVMRFWIIWAFLSFIGILIWMINI